MFSLHERSLYVRDLDLWIDSMRPRARCYVSHGHADHARAHDVVVTSVNNAKVCALRFGRKLAKAAARSEAAIADAALKAARPEAAFEDLRPESPFEAPRPESTFEAPRPQSTFEAPRPESAFEAPRSERSSEVTRPETVFEVHEFNDPWRLGDCELTLFSAGHVLGSAQLLIEGERGRFVYTGDFKLEPSFTAEPPEVKRCDTLLMECTYGRPQYVFPPRAEVAGAMVAWARAALEDGAVPIFFAYSLGKAQEAMAILGRGGIPLAAHGAVAAMARVYEEAGVALPPYERYDAASFDGARALIWPPSGRALPAAVRGKAVRTAALTGWVVGKGTNFVARTDAGFPLSDHADFPSLLRYIELAQPKKVLLNHGWRDFVYRLRKLGIDAEYLESNPQLALF